MLTFNSIDDYQPERLAKTIESSYGKPIGSDPKRWGKEEKDRTITLIKGHPVNHKTGLELR